MSRPCYCNDCRAVREAPISVGKGTERYGHFLVAGTAIRIGDNTYSYSNDEIYLPNDLEGFWMGKDRKRIGVREFLESYLTGHTIEKIFHGSLGWPRD